MSGTPPSYERASIDRGSPRARGRDLDESSTVPPPLFLRSSSPHISSAKGSIKILVPAWGVALVRPPRPATHIHPLDTRPRSPEPPANDTVLTGALEVTMKERRRCQAISVGVQGVCKLHMGESRMWECDGVFERGVQVLGGDSGGIWLEKGSQTFSFSILLPATLATEEWLPYARLHYRLTARAEGITSASSSFTSLFGKKPGDTSAGIPYSEDFDSVVAKSDKLAHDLSHHQHHHTGNLSPQMRALSLGGGGSPDERSSPGASGSSPTLTGLYHRRQSNDIQRIPSIDMPDAVSVRSYSFGSGGGPSSGERSERDGWLKGDICGSRHLSVHSISARGGGPSQLDLRKDGGVDGLGTWKFHGTADVFAISSPLVISFQAPSPSSACTIFLVRLLLSQTYTLTSPRTPQLAPHKPESASQHVLYQGGRPHKSGERFPAREADSLWRGADAGGDRRGKEQGGEGLWVRSLVRLPTHEKIRPSTSAGTITPIRVTHELVLQVFYSVDGESVTGAPNPGPGELRMMSVRMAIHLPSCCCMVDSLSLPTYEQHDECPNNIEGVFTDPPPGLKCMCGMNFEELAAGARRRLKAMDDEEATGRAAGDDAMDGSLGMDDRGAGSARYGARPGMGPRMSSSQSCKVQEAEGRE